MLRKAFLLLLASAAALTFASPASAVVVGTHNLHNGEGQVRPFANIIGWQEAEVAQTPRVMNKLRALAGYKTWFPEGDRPKRFSANAVPISYKRGTYDVVGKGKVRTHRGESNVTPDRFVVWIVLRNKKTGKQLTVVNTHFINGAFKDKFANRAHRRDLWNTHLAALQQQVAALRAQYGSPVVVTGDFNRYESSPIPGVRRVDGPGSGGAIDQIYAEQGVPTGPAKQRSRFGSDHNAWTANIKLP